MLHQNFISLTVKVLFWNMISLFKKGYMLSNIFVLWGSEKSVLVAANTVEIKFGVNKSLNYNNEIYFKSLYNGKMKVAQFYRNCRV